MRKMGNDNKYNVLYYFDFTRNMQLNNQLMNIINYYSETCEQRPSKGDTEYSFYRQVVFI